MAEILQFEKSQKRYLNIAEGRQKEGDLEGALLALFDGEKVSHSYEIYREIAKIYSQMDLLEQSNKYWFKYMFYAPDNEVSISYEELAINYYYLDNLWAAGYYMHKKLSVDGYINRDDIDKEVLDFFSGEELRKNAYRIVYPYDMANYQPEIKSAKRALRAGDFKHAVHSLEKVPSPCLDQESDGELTLALVMNDELDRAEQHARQNIERFGQNVGAYCNLSTIYQMREDEDKAMYYYQKALSLRKGDEDEPYKIATCSIELSDHITTKECIEKILQDRPYETPMRFFYAIALINLGDYTGAINELKKAYRLDPTDYCVQYYLDIAKGLKDKTCSEKILPIAYVKELPKKVVQARQKTIKEMLKNPKNLSSDIKKNFKILKWGLEFGDEQTVKTCAMLLSTRSAKKFFEIAIDLLLDPSQKLETKQLILYALILKGYKGKIGFVLGSFYTSYVQKNMAFDKGKEVGTYFSAYALCMSRMAFYGVEDLSKIPQTADRVYNGLKNQISEAEVNNEEIAGLILLECGYEDFDKVEKVCKVFEVGQKKLSLLKSMLQQK